MYIQTPGVGAPGLEALSKEWSASPLARRGALRPPLWVVCAQRGHSCHSCLLSQPKEEVLSKERTGPQKPRWQAAPLSSTSGAQELFA